MINHYIDLHEYINENIYRLPVKENQIITEAIDWGGVIKNTLIGGGIIGLIILLFKILGGNTSSGSSGGGGGSSSTGSSSSNNSKILTFRINDNEKHYNDFDNLLNKINSKEYQDRKKWIRNYLFSNCQNYINDIINEINDLKIE